MQILAIHLKNIKAHRHAEFSFAPGINVLSGRNGVGKSTIFEAIGYALFGVDARDFVSRADRFVSLGEKKGEIAVFFATGDGQKWRVTRTVGGGSRWLLARSTGSDYEVEEHANAHETEARIKKLLGLSGNRPLADQFKQIIGPFQHDFLGPFVIKSPTERQKTFDVTLGIDSWRQTYEGTSRLQSAVQGRIDNLLTEIEARTEQVVILPEKKQALKAVIADEKSRRTTLEENTRTLQHQEKQLEIFDNQEKNLARLQVEMNRVGDRIASGKEHIATQQTLLEQAKAARDIVEQSQAGKEAFEQAEANLINLREQEKRYLANERKKAQLEKELSTLQQKFDLENREVAATRRQLEEEARSLEALLASLQPPGETQALARGVTDQRKSLDELRDHRSILQGHRQSLLEGRGKLDEGICPFFQEPCQNLAGKPPRDVLITRVEDIDTRILQLDRAIEQQGEKLCTAEKAEKDLAELVIRRTELGKQQQALAVKAARNQERANRAETMQPLLEQKSSEIAKLLQQLEGFADLEKRIAATDQERARHQQARDAYHGHFKVAEELPGRLKTLDRYRQALSQLENELGALGRELKTLQDGYRADEHNALRRDKENLLARSGALKQELKDLGREKVRLNGEIETLQKIQADIDAKTLTLRSLRDKERLVKFLRSQVFKNVSGRLSERFREEISRRADRIYRTIAETDEELSWGENYQVVLRDLAQGKIRERTDDQLSGGQMMSAVVALRLALLQTIGARVAFFDEPTSNLDATRRENLARAFRAIDIGQEEVTEHWYDQLFLISHDVAFTEITDQLLDLGPQDI